VNPTQRDGSDLSGGTVWIRIHPAGYSTAFDALNKSAGIVSRSAEGVNGTSTSVVEVIDLRNEINAFEISGPRSNQLIWKTLTLVPGTASKEQEQVMYMIARVSRDLVLFSTSM
jgi:hypothetical protein